jgi:hypothetical protein
LTVAGDVRLERLYLVCPRCRGSHYPLDDRLGLTGFVSPQAHKLLTLAGASWSFDRAAQLPAEFCGLRTCDQTIRQICYAEAGLVADWLHTDAAAGVGFAAAGGDTEFQTDSTMVNTWEGWREIRLGVFAKRPRGQPAHRTGGTAGRCRRLAPWSCSGPSRRRRTSARASGAGRAGWGPATRRC